jgi:prevent-host-death family protein
MSTLQKSIPWQLQDAQQKFGEVIERTSQEPQIIVVKGKEVAIILSIDNYNKLVQQKPNLYEFFQNSPLKDVDLDLERDDSAETRDIEW